ncbi:hypothetical protein Vadar_030107 [Vaccinium darrowii]|uniref:Uncharacterized protein n=1 Tax=Vaccinium darrowii TaxID=229202 RepID=A0ACB7YZG5_9ERIC|nr:hypothetical protein Vadar_030107 [Vaccinium darrowii]
MEVGRLSSDVVALEKLMLFAAVEALVMETLLAAQRSIGFFLVAAGTMLNDVNVLPNFTGIDGSFPIDELHRRKCPGPENKDASDTDDDDEDEVDDDDEDDVDDAGDEDFSGEEGGDDDDDEDGDPEEAPPANGNGGNDDEDEDDEDDDEDDEGDEEDEDEEEDEEDEDQPPAKKRKCSFQPKRHIPWLASNPVRPGSFNNSIWPRDLRQLCLAPCGSSLGFVKPLAEKTGTSEAKMVAADARQLPTIPPNVVPTIPPRQEYEGVTEPHKRSLVRLFH